MSPTEPRQVPLRNLRVGDYLPLLGVEVTHVETVRYGRSKSLISTVCYALSDGRTLLAHDGSLLYRDAQGRLKVIFERPRITSLIEVISPPLVSD